MASRQNDKTVLHTFLIPESLMLDGLLRHFNTKDPV